MNSRSPNALQRYLLERLIGPAAQHVPRQPGSFLWQSIKGFRARDSRTTAHAETVTLKDGRNFFIGEIPIT